MMDKSEFRHRLNVMVGVCKETVHAAWTVHDAAAANRDCGRLVADLRSKAESAQRAISDLVAWVEDQTVHHGG